MPIASLGAVSLDTDDPRPLAAFYRDLLELDTMFDSDAFVALRGAGILLTFQRVEHHRPATWPGADVPKQIHLELGTADLDAAEAAAVALGAERAPEQPREDAWRVLIDPAGHPFCLTTMLPET